MIASGRNGGTWTGTGLTSTAAKNDSAASTALGYMEASTYKSIFGDSALFNGESIHRTAVVIRHSYYGDADLDGGVSINDFKSLSTSFGATSRSLQDGHFDYDDGVSINHFNLLSSNFGKTLPVAASHPAVKKGVAPAMVKRGDSHFLLVRP